MTSIGCAGLPLDHVVPGHYLITPSSPSIEYQPTATQVQSIARSTGDTIETSMTNCKMSKRVAGKTAAVGN